MRKIAKSCKNRFKWSQNFNNKAGLVFFHLIEPNNLILNANFTH